MSCLLSDCSGLDGYNRGGSRKSEAVFRAVLLYCNHLLSWVLRMCPCVVALSAVDVLSCEALDCTGVLRPFSLFTFCWKSKMNSASVSWQVTKMLKMIRSELEGLALSALSFLL